MSAETTPVSSPSLESLRERKMLLQAEPAFARLWAAQSLGTLAYRMFQMALLWAMLDVPLAGPGLSVALPPLLQVTPSVPWKFALGELRRN